MSESPFLKFHLHKYIGFHAKFNKMKNSNNIGWILWNESLQNTK